VKNKLDARSFREALFRGERCETVHWESGRCRAQAAGSRVLSDFSAGKDLLLLADSKTDEVIDVMKHGGRKKDQAIKPVENTAMSRNEF